MMGTHPESPPAAFVGGVAGGGGFLVVELAARVVAGIPTLPELIQDRLVQALPGPVFSFVLDRLLYLGKRCCSLACCFCSWSLVAWLPWCSPAGDGAPRSSPGCGS